MMHSVKQHSENMLTLLHWLTWEGLQHASVGHTVLNQCLTILQSLQWNCF